LSDNRRYLEPPEDGEPLVTYSRIDPRRARPAPARDGRVEPHIDAREVPWTDEPAPAPDLRAVPFDTVDPRSPGLAVDPLSPPRRGRGLRIVLAAGVFAVVAGAAILAVAFFSAGYGPPRLSTSTATEGEGPSLATRATADPLAADEAGTDGNPGPGVRAIPLGDGTGGDAVPAATDAAADPAATAPAPPPVPRPRPEHAVASAPAEPAAEADGAAGVAPPPDGSAVAVSPPPPAAAEPAADGDFITRIEQTLANMPAGSSLAPAPAVAPAPAAAAASPTLAPAPEAPAPMPDSTLVLTPAAPAPVTAAGEDQPALDWSAAGGEPLPTEGGTVFTIEPPASGPIPPADIPNVPPAASGFQ
jgi:hypothetical protein